MNKKTYTIGRGEECDIVINDSQGIVSRNHAILKARPFGKYDIIDVGKNGTWVNGSRIKSHLPVKVSRKDSIMFANNCRLDWTQVPKNVSWELIAMKSFAAIIIILLLIWGITWAISLFDDNFTDDTPKGIDETTSLTTGGDTADKASGNDEVEQKGGYVFDTSGLTADKPKHKNKKEVKSENKSTHKADKETTKTSTTAGSESTESNTESNSPNGKRTGSNR